MTPFWSHSYGTRSRGAVDKWFSNGASDIAHWFNGAVADELYMTGEPASGNIVGKLNGNVLTPVSTPAYRQTLTGDPGDPLGVSFTNSSTDSFDGNYHNHTTGAMARLVTYVVGFSSLNRCVMGRSANGVSAGAKILRPSGTWSAFFSGTEGTINGDYSPGALDGTARWVLQFLSITEDIAGSYSSTDGEQTTSLTVSPVGDITSAANYSLGSLGTMLSAGITIGPTLEFSGAEAERIINVRATDIATWWTS